MTVQEITNGESFVNDVLKSEAPVVVDFFADWCAPCRQVSPVIEALSAKWEGTVRFVKLDVDRVPEVSNALQISSIPTVALFEGGEVKAFSVGAKSGTEFELELGLGLDDAAAAAGAAMPPDREPRGFLAAITAWWRGP